jgi:hypothetical protein
MRSHMSDVDDAIEDREVAASRDQFYPGWRTYAGHQFGSENLKPYYRIVCRTELECDLARRAKPDFVRVEFVEQFKHCT